MNGNLKQLRGIYSNMKQHKKIRTVSDWIAYLRATKKLNRIPILNSTVVVASKLIIALEF